MPVPLCTIIVVLQAAQRDLLPGLEAGEIFNEIIDHTDIFTVQVWLEKLPLLVLQIQSQACCISIIMLIIICIVLYTFYMYYFIIFVVHICITFTTVYQVAQITMIMIFIFKIYR